MSETDDHSLELRRIRRLLKQMYNMAQDASLTGALSGGAADAVQQYNRILKRLEELGVASLTLFQPLPEDACFDRLGVASKLLESYVAEEASTDNRTGGGAANVIIGNIGGLDDLKDLGRTIRENLPDFLRKYAPQTAEPAAAAAAAAGGPPGGAGGPSSRAAASAPAAPEDDPIPMPNLSR